MMLLDGLILAGGANRRMHGRYKGSLRLGNRTFVECVRAELAKCTGQIWISYGTKRWEDVPGCVAVMDRYPDCGPAGGLHAGLMAVKEKGRDGVLTAACDMPSIKAGLYEHLLRKMKRHQKETGRMPDGVVPMADGRMHPLAAVYRTTLTDILEKHLRARLYRVTDILRDADILYVDLSERPDLIRMLSNINTPEEYHRIKGESRIKGQDTNIRME